MAYTRFLLPFLRDIELSLKPLLDSIGEGFLIADQLGTPRMWNAAAERILGAATLRHEEGEWTARPGVLSMDGVTPLPGEKRPLPRAIRGELVDDQEFIVRSAGVDVVVSCTARALRQDGEIVGGVAVFREITERRRVESALRASERLYRTLARSLPSSVILMFDRDMRLILAEGGGLAIAGLHPSMIEGRPVFEYASPSILGDYAAVFEGRSADVEVVRAENRHYRVQLVPVRDEAGDIFAGLMVATDLTEQRKRDEQRQRDEHFRVLAEAIPQIVWTANSDGGLDYFNARWFDYTGKTFEETRGWGWTPIVHDDDVAKCVHHWREALRTGGVFEVDCRFKRASDGAYRWHLVRAHPFRDTHGRITKWFGTATDIEDQRVAQRILQDAQEELEARVAERTAQLSLANEALRRETIERRTSEERFRAAISGMLDAFYILESVRNAEGAIVDFRIVEVNEAAVTWIGGPRATIIGMLASEITDPSTSARIFAVHRAVIESGEPREWEFKVQLHQEAPRWARQQIVPLGDGLAVTARDTTAEKNHKELLELHSAIVRNMSEGVSAVTVAGGIIVYANPKLEQMLGYDPGELDGRSITTLRAPVLMEEPQVTAIRNELLATGAAAYETVNMKKDGTFIYCRVAIGTIDHPEHGPVWVAVREDITERKRAREEIERSLGEKEVLLKEIHHRVKNNLQVISSLLKLHAEQVSQPEARAAFEDSQGRVHAIALLHEKLYESKDLGSVDLGTYAKSLISTLIRTHGQRGSNAQISVETEGISLAADRAVPFGLILNELLTNSFKHAFSSSSVRPAVRVAVVRRGNELELTVHDNGPGLPESFEVARVSSLGLQLVRTLSRQLRGVLRMQTDNGTRSTVTFPEYAEGA